MRSPWFLAHRRQGPHLVPSHNLYVAQVLLGRVQLRQPQGLLYRIRDIRHGPVQVGAEIPQNGLRPLAVCGQPRGYHPAHGVQERGGQLLGV